MADWGTYILGFMFFFISHSIPTRPKVKAQIVARLGTTGFTLAYSALSTFALIVLIWVARTAPHVTLWQWAEWQNHIALTGMCVATLLVALTLGRPNPLSFGGWGHARYDPKHAGIIGWVRHPLLLVLLIWSLSHLLPNGDLAHVIMFGCFAVFSLLGVKLIDRRKKRQLGAEEWSRLSHTKRAFTPTLNGSVRLVVGLVLYGLIIWAHEPVIGISPLP